MREFSEEHRDNLSQSVLRTLARGVSWDQDDEEFIAMWNDPAMASHDIAKALSRTPNALRVRATALRIQGIEMMDRTSLEPPAPQCQPFVMPDGMRFEDDPRAVADMGSRYMPRKPDYQSAGSSLNGSSRLIGMSGRGGAV